MPNDGIRLKIILIIEVRKLEFTDFDSHSHYNHEAILLLIYYLIANNFLVKAYKSFLSVV